MIHIGINASRYRSGGARNHLRGLLKHGNPLAYGIQKVHVWSFKALLDKLPNEPWLVKHNPVALERSLFHQLLWEYRDLPGEARAARCHVLLNADAGSICDFHPSVVMSHDMLSFEAQEMNRYGLTLGRLRLVVLRYVQARSIRRADGVIFLSRYAADTIQTVIGPVDEYAIIPHGVSSSFRQSISRSFPDPNADEAIRCIYVSNALPYKHQWHVITAIAQLRHSGYNLSLLLVGGGTGRAQKKLEGAMRRVDPHGSFVNQMDFVNHEDLPHILGDSDIFVFASSCENMPIILIEAMAMGLPVACSDRGPMPEVLQDAGVYFDPENPASIASAIQEIITDTKKRIFLAQRAKTLSGQFTWEKCADNTWRYFGRFISSTPAIA